MKRISFVFLFTLYSCIAIAFHITGGEMIYEYIGPGSQPNTRAYRITLKLFRDQNTVQGAPMPPSVFIGLFNNDNNRQFPSDSLPFTVPLNNEEQVKINTYPQCVKNATPLDYHVGFYTLTIELPNNSSGYTAAYQTCCRVSPLNNVFTTSTNVSTGSTYSCVIPPLADASPVFASNIDLICYNRQFTLNFNATDKDGDSLVYSFAEAFNGGSAIDAGNINPAAPPYSAVTYISNFTGLRPLGNKAVINARTGVISGIAPPAGRYVVCVTVKSYKNRVYVGEHTKDFIVNVGDCDVPGAQLALKPVTCNGYAVTFTNDNPSPLNKTYFWDFGDPKSGALNTSTSENPTHVYSDTGVFVYKLIVNKGEPCADSASQTVKVYPGFSPGFITTGKCRGTPIQFFDTTKSRYGTVNSWSWNFADPQRTDDTSRQKNSVYTFTSPGNYDVKLIVTDTRGCIDTVTRSIAITDQPDFTIINDTLICSIDTLQLQSAGTGTFFWTPAYNISDQNIASPLVSPDVPTKYYVNFSDIYNCKGTDSVFVDVKHFVTLDAGNDTSICTSDTIILTPASDGLQYKWEPSNTLNNAALKTPAATPLTTTTYTVTTSIGKCESTDSIIVKVTPYPIADAGDDSTICMGSSVQLNATGGSFYKWSPAFFLDDPDIANPIANPINDINYTVTVYDTLGCPKPGRDAVVITVLHVVADAGPTDTAIVVNQPLQLNASGGEFYIWSPPAGLSNSTIKDPIAVIDDSRKYVVTVQKAGCLGSDTINITVFKIEPGLYVPNAFTPNNDGKNDVLRPIPVGMKTVSYFRVYNRWGKLMFSTSQIGNGWDGTFKGKAQDSAAYVWIAEGIDYLGKKISRKGSVVLLR